MSQNIFSNEAFAAWCFEQGDKYFHYGDGQNCAVHQYLTSKGIKVAGVGGDYWRMGKDDRRLLPPGWPDKLTHAENGGSFKKLGELLLAE